MKAFVPWGPRPNPRLIPRWTSRLVPRTRVRVRVWLGVYYDLGNFARQLLLGKGMALGPTFRGSNRVVSLW
jgi:hypothetical protein